MKRKTKIKDVIAFLQGHFRYRLYYTKFAFLIPEHIREQIEYRINSMNPQCYKEGQCVMCGCTTTALQMANKACDKPCYPVMLTKGNWKWVKQGGSILNDSNIWSVDTENKEFKITQYGTGEMD